MLNSSNTNKQPDFIGDIHGHFDALEMLFKKMGYEKKNGVYSHSERFPVFIGDYVDRGPKILETLHLVRSMQENGTALAIMGNHEYNYLCYHLKDENDKPFRENSPKNEKLLNGTNQALNNLDERDSYLTWMASLPVTLETDNYRAVHAQWNDKSIELLKKSGIIKFDETGLRILQNDQKLLVGLELLLKGYEVKGLPKKMHYLDDEKQNRTEGRIKWWELSSGNKFGDVFASLPHAVRDKNISRFKHNFKDFYKLSNKPVFFGHYWLSPNDFALTSVNTCCVDFSIANDGLLVAYRFNGEQKLNPMNLINHAD